MTSPNEHTPPRDGGLEGQPAPPHCSVLIGLPADTLEHLKLVGLVHDETVRKSDIELRSAPTLDHPVVGNIYANNLEGLTDPIAIFDTLKRGLESGAFPIVVHFPAVETGAPLPVYALSLSHYSAPSFELGAFQASIVEHIRFHLTNISFISDEILFSDHNALVAEKDATIERLSHKLKCVQELADDDRDEANRLVAARDREIERLRQIISEAASAIGAGIAPTASVEFMANLPREIEMVRERLTRDRDAYRDERDNLTTIVKTEIDSVAGAELDELTERAEAAEARASTAEQQLAEAREANRRLHRRAQLAEAISEAVVSVFEGWLAYFDQRTKSGHPLRDRYLFRLALREAKRKADKASARLAALNGGAGK